MRSLTPTLEGYSYLNLTDVGQAGGAAANGDGGNQYTGLDRFDRVSDQNWDWTGGGTAARYQYGYDRDGNALYRKLRQAKPSFMNSMNWRRARGERRSPPRSNADPSSAHLGTKPLRRFLMRHQASSGDNGSRSGVARKSDGRVDCG